MTAEELLDWYYTFAAEGAGVLDFVDQVLSGTYGPPERSALLSFLDLLQSLILRNIGTHWEETPPHIDDMDRVVDEVCRELDHARTKIMAVLG
jgi:hypothetical protein